MTPAGSAMLRYFARTTQFLLYRGGMRDGTTFFVVQGCGTYTGWDTAALGDELTLPREMLDDGMMTYTSYARLLIGDTYRDAGWDGATFGGSVFGAGDAGRKASTREGC